MVLNQNGDDDDVNLIFNSVSDDDDVVNLIFNSVRTDIQFYFWSLNVKT